MRYFNFMLPALLACSIAAPALAQNVSRVHVSGVSVIRDDASLGVAFTVNPDKWHLPLTREVCNR